VKVKAPPGGKSSIQFGWLCLLSYISNPNTLLAWI
jgi:hypothetical protein